MIILYVLVILIVICTISRGVLKMLIHKNGGICSSENLSNRRIPYLVTVTNDTKELFLLKFIVVINKIYQILIRLFIFIFVVYIIINRER